MNIELVTSSTAELIKHNVSDVDVARAAWVSNYGEDAREKDTSKIEGLINFLYRERHMSPFEHGSMTFFIDCPIFVAREFHRHRTMSYNEVSGRYTTLNPRFYVPSAERPLIQEGKVGAYTFVPGSTEQSALVRSTIERHSRQAWKEYNNMLQWGVAREVARDVLPVNIMTQFYATVNPRNLIQFLTLRDDKHALFEIRDLASQMDSMFAQIMPITHGAYRAGRDMSLIEQQLREEINEQKKMIEQLIREVNKGV